jgi:hypothetical protein
MMFVPHRKHAYRPALPVTGGGEREKGVVMRETTMGEGGGQEEFILGFEGSQAVLSNPCGRGKAFDEN